MFYRRRREDTGDSSVKTIFKYPIEVVDSQEIKMPIGAEVLTVQVQGDIPCLWALVESSVPSESRTILIFGTGHPVSGLNNKYIGTFQLGALVFHVFEPLI